MKTQSVIERKISYPEKKISISTTSFSVPWSPAGTVKFFNCLYIHYCKQDFPELNHPEVRPPGKIITHPSFDYHESDIATLDWHCGITFYQELTCGESGRTIVKAGCDFQHLYDDHWMTGDFGQEILDRYGPTIVREFDELVTRRRSS